MKAKPFHVKYTRSRFYLTPPWASRGGMFPLQRMCDRAAAYLGAERNAR